jgi:sugar/nucleoside kinase (ribokinase family)
MKTYDICTVGHITLDKVVTPQNTKLMAGGTAYYLSKALSRLNASASLVTAVSEAENPVLKEVESDGIHVFNLPTRNTVYFENIYGDDMNRRDQNVLQTADPIGPGNFPDVRAKIYHLGALLANDIPSGLIRHLHKKGDISMDIQGHLRHLRYQKVRYKDWDEKREALQYVRILKANEFEMSVITGTKDIAKGARHLAELGVKEVVITLGEQGSVIMADGTFTSIPAFRPVRLADTTGCGDSYMAGYLFKRVQGKSISEAGTFGSALASIKTEQFGPFAGNIESIEKVIANAPRAFPGVLEISLTS